MGWEFLSLTIFKVCSWETRSCSFSSCIFLRVASRLAKATRDDSSFLEIIFLRSWIYLLDSLSCKERRFTMSSCFSVVVIKTRGCVVGCTWGPLLKDIAFVLTVCCPLPQFWLFSIGVTTSLDFKLLLFCLKLLLLLLDICNFLWYYSASSFIFLLIGPT